MILLYLHLCFQSVHKNILFSLCQMNVCVCSFLLKLHCFKFTDLNHFPLLEHPHRLGFQQKVCDYNECVTGIKTQTETSSSSTPKGWWGSSLREHSPSFRLRSEESRETKLWWGKNCRLCFKQCSFCMGLFLRRCFVYGNSGYMSTAVEKTAVA